MTKRDITIIDLDDRYYLSKNTMHPIQTSNATLVHKLSQEKPKNCPNLLVYPSYIYPTGCSSNRLVVWPLQRHGMHYQPIDPVYDDGIVFYVYGVNKHSSMRYMNQVLINAEAIKSKDPNAHIALITNFDVPSTIAQSIDVIIPVHRKDLVKGIQWFTRVLYNKYLPFNYSYILDTHVFPCYNNSYSQLFKLFKESNVDVSVSNRMNVRSISGGAVLSKRGPGSLAFWSRCVDFMRSYNNNNDQVAIAYALRSRENYKFRQLSSNWFFASNGILSSGRFKGSSKCYRSSVVVTGPVHWIHGSPKECSIMNGENDEYNTRYRSYFRCNRCKCAIKKPFPIVAFSDSELQSFASPNKAPKLLWEKDDIRDSHALFWDLNL